MTKADPNGVLGRSEDGLFAVQPIDVLTSPVCVARQVVGLLNATNGDGEIWIGYEVQSGIAVAPQAIADVEGASQRLRGYLFDTIEPVLSLDRDITLACLNGQIRISMNPGRSRPYALREDGLRYWLRVPGGTAIREMAMDEVAEAMGATIGGLDAINRTLRQARELSDERTNAHDPAFWLWMAPTPPPSIDFAESAQRDEVTAWLTNPARTGNRRRGVSFVDPLEEPIFNSERVTQGNGRYRWIEITSSAVVTFMSATSPLFDVSGSSRRELDAYALLELPTSVFRLMGRILERHARREAGGHVVAALVVNDMTSARLRRGSPRDLESLRTPRELERAPRDVLQVDPFSLIFQANALRENPDRCALRLIRAIYAQFGFDTDAIPPEFDQERGVLRLG